MNFELFVAARYLRAKRRQVEASARRLRNPEHSEGPVSEVPDEV